MKISNYESFLKIIEERKKRFNNEQQNIKLEEGKIKRKELIELFPFVIVLYGKYDEHDFASKWLWENIGEQNCDKCIEQESEYPGCPLVLATEYTEGDYKKYKKVEDHSHKGNWAINWLGKYGYDYGFGEFYFKNKIDQDQFLDFIFQNEYFL